MRLREEYKKTPGEKIIRRRLTEERRKLAEHKRAIKEHQLTYKLGIYQRENKTLSPGRYA